ncbi:MAG: hypothetical protein GX196_03425 [Clostridiaceae bacterium]|nr:hypothetical protein [Clostridiaceae bacterium]
MSNTEENIKKLLSDPEVVDKVSKLIANIKGEEEKEEFQTNDLAIPDDIKIESPKVEDSQINKISEVLSSISNKNDPHMNLLMAVKPYLSERRKAKMDHAIKILQIGRLFSNLDLFRK